MGILGMGKWNGMEWEYCTRMEWVLLNGCADVHEDLPTYFPADLQVVNAEVTVELKI